MPYNPKSKLNLKPPPVKGEVRNPLGARSHDPLRKELKKFTLQYMRDVIEIAVMGDLAALQAIVSDPTAPVIKIGIAMCLHKAVKDKNWELLNEIISRIIGKVPDKIEAEVTASIESTEEKEQRRKRLEEKMKALNDARGN